MSSHRGVRASMSVPSMVHRSGDSLIVRSVVSGDALFGSADAVQDSDEDPPTSSSSEFSSSNNNNDNKDLPECKVKRNYSCASCDFFTQNPRHHLYHLRDVHLEKVKIYECPNCLYASKHFQKLLRHTKMVHGGGGGGGGSSDSGNNNNNNSGSVDAIATPPQSRNSKKRSLPLLATPIEDDDIGTIPDDLEDTAGVFKCSVCAFVAKNRALLARHEREEHIKTKFFRCTKCTYVTHMKARFTKHVKYHSMPMIKCDMCDFRTPYKWNLDRHCKNHNGKGAFKCSACNFTADIKQSLTVHEMNHHVPPVGQAAGLGVGRRRNKVGASDATAAEDAAVARQQEQVKSGGEDIDDITTTIKTNRSEQQQPSTKKLKNSTIYHHSPEQQGSFGPDFIHPDDIIHHANGNVYIKNKCKLCNFKSAWNSEMAKHEKKVHNIIRETSPKPIKKSTRPIPNLIPIPTQSTGLKLNKKTHQQQQQQKLELPDEPIMSQQDIKEICAKSANSALKDFASLFGSEDVFKDLTVENKVPDLLPATFTTNTPKTNNDNNNNNNNNGDDFKQKHASFFDRLKEKLMTVDSGNLICTICGHESKCLTEHATHEKICGKKCNNIQTLHPTFLKSTRCPYCRQRCKTSAILDNHLQTCPEALKATIKTEDESENELKIDESQSEDGDITMNNNNNNKPHPMENRVFVWNNITVPMDIEIDDSKYEYLEDKVDDNISLDLSVRTQSPGGSESSYMGGQDYINNNNNHHHNNNNNNNNNNNISNNNNNNANNNNNNNSHHHSPASTDKIPTHGNDISIAQHKRVFKCPHCSFWASTASRFHVHIVGHLNKKPFECSLCAYRSNWRWDITKHIKLKSVRDPAHENAKVLMTDETGRRNYTKYNKYLTEIHVSGDQTMDTSGGSGTRPRHHHDGRNLRSTSPNNNNNNNSNNQNKNELPKLQRVPNNNDFNPLLKSGNLRPPPPLKAADGVFFDKKRNGTENKRTLFKCKKCNFRDASREILLAHVKGHYTQQNIVDSSSSLSPTTTTTTTTVATNNNNNIQDMNIVRGVSPDKDERHCRLKHSGDIRVVSNKNGQEKLEVEEQTDEPDHIDVPQDGAYKCNSCPYSNDDQNEFKQHLNGHLPSSDSIMKCHYCNYFVTKRDDLIDHFKLHGIEDVEDFFNKLMDRSNNSDGDMGKRFRCLICPYVTNSKSQYTYHKQFHKPRGGQYTCTQCSYNVSKRHLLHQHLKVHGINIVPLKQNGEIIDLDEISDEIEEIPTNNNNNNQFETQTFSDIPLVWVSKNGKFSKMFKCRYCPHVNLRKVNIQEHEKMHSVREKNPNSSRSNDVEHHCSECNYICNNAGVLSSHSKVHQGLYGTVHCLVDPIKTDEEQIRELSKYLNPSQLVDTINLDEYENAESSTVMMDIDEQINDDNGNCLYFCKECPARFLKENEFNIHSRLHGVRLFYKCDYCSYSARQKPHLLAHSKVHTSEYQERTKVLQSLHYTNNIPPQTYPINGNNGDLIWVVSDNKSNDLEMDIELMRNRPIKSSINNVPLSGTELFQQKSEAQQKQAQLLKQSTTTTTTSPPSPKYSDPQFGTLMHGNPEFIYPTYLKNGRMKEKRYKCHKCPSAFEKREQYRIHLNLHGSEQRYRCEYCDYSVKYYANYVQHLKKHKMNTDAQQEAANRRHSNDDCGGGDDGGVNNNNNNDVDMLIDQVTNDDDDDNRNSLIINKLSTGDQQAYKILQQRLVNSTSPIKETNDDKKFFSCSNCPYVNYRKDAVDNHQRRHISISGIKNNFTCEHCDYSVPQAHFLRDHNKLHFLQTTKNHVDGYMVCDDIKLISNKNNNNNDDGGNNSDYNNSDSDIIFEEHDEEYLPPLNKDIVERFNNNNNNEGEKRFVNIETGDVGDKIDNSKIMVVDGDNNNKVDES